jgi:hypothetical protein
MGFGSARSRYVWYRAYSSDPNHALEVVRSLVPIGGCSFLSSKESFVARAERCPSIDFFNWQFPVRRFAETATHRRYKYLRNRDITTIKEDGGLNMG